MRERRPRNRLWLAIAITGAAALSARADVRTIQRTFPGEPGAALKVDTYRGIIEVEASADRQFHFEITLDPGTDDAAKSKRLLDRVETDFRRNGPEVALRMRNPSETGPHLQFEDREQRVSVEIRCLVPQPCALDLATNDGSVHLADLAGRIRARTRNGTIYFRHIDGDIDVAAERGDIIISHCLGSARLKVLVGNIRTGPITGRVEARATNGDIEVQHVAGGGLLSTTAGDVTAGISQDYSGETRIETDGGSILIRLGRGARCTLEAKTVWGRIHLNPLVPLVVSSGGNGKKTLAGKVNGGGPLLALRASGGQIRIEPPRGEEQ